MVKDSVDLGASVPPVLLPSGRGLSRSLLMVADSALILKRFYFLQRALIRVEAGWIPGLAGWDGKLLLPEIVWQDGLVARALRERVLELRYPERRIEPDSDQTLMEAYAHLADAPNELGFLLALHRAIKPHVRRLFADHLKAADALDDAPSAHFLSHALIDLDGQIARLGNAARAVAAANPEQLAGAERWTGQVETWLGSLPPEALIRPTLDSMPVFDFAAAGGKPFAISRLASRDARFHRLRFAWPDRHTPQQPGTGPQLQIRQAVHHINEVWAAEMAAACIYDLADRAPHDFLDDATRWCFDEIRHCRMGYERLREWGFSPDEMPLDSFSYDAGAKHDALIRLGIIFFFETTYIHTKPERAKLFGNAGDRLSSHDMDFDWADELIHTHYGKRWLDHFLKEEGAGRLPADIKRLAEQSVAELQRSATDQDKAQTQAAFDRVLAKAHLA